MSVTREDRSNCKVVTALVPSKLEATKDDLEGIDVSGLDSATVIALIGSSDVALDDANYLEIELQHSDRHDGGFVACADRDVEGFVPGTNRGTFCKVSAAVPLGGMIFSAGYKGSKRYIRPVVRCTGNAHGDQNHGTLVSITANLRGSGYLPITS